MSFHTRTSVLVHYVFSTKLRLPVIPVVMQPRLWAYVGGIARTNNMKALAIGGMPDHLHVLLSLPPNMTVSKAIQLVKGGSSKWMHEQQGTRFEWQIGYGAFTIGISQMKGTVDYILNQEKHHAKRSFVQEWKDVLEAPRAGRLRGINSAVPDGTRHVSLANPAVPAGLLSHAPTGAPRDS